jgi:hydroxymethylpyrimidine pyrophosphatase-like HAD family hydrolase
MRIVTRVRHFSAPVLKMELWFTQPARCQEAWAALGALGRTATARVSPHNLEVTHPLATKGAALGFVCAREGLTPGEAVAFGDSANDLTLRAYVGKLVAMGNASAELKALADTVAPEAAADGVAGILNAWLEEERG